MLSRQIIDQFQPYDFDRLAHKEKDGRRRLRLIALAHLKDGKHYLEVAAALHACCHALGAMVYRRRRGPSGRSAT